MKHGFSYTSLGRRVVASGAAVAAQSLRERFYGKKPGGGGKGSVKKGQKKRVRRKTRTRSKKKRKNSMQSVSQHNNENSIRLPPIKLSSHKLPHKLKFKWQNMRQFTQVQNAGIQSVFGGPTVNGTVAQFTGTVSNSRSDKEKWEVDPFTLNPYCSLPSSVLYAGAIPQVISNDTLYYHGFKQHFSMINLETNACEVQVVWCLCKENSSRSPVDIWGECILEEKITQPGAIIANSVATAVAVGGYPTIYQYGTHPAEYKTWSKYWAIKDTFRYTLQPGDQVNFSREVIYNKKLTRKFFELIPTAYIKGITLWPMFIVRGSMVGLHIATGVPDTGKAVEVTYGPTKLGIIENQEHRFGGVPVGDNLYTTRVFPGIVEEPIATNIQTHINDVDVSAVVDST